LKWKPSAANSRPRKLFPESPGRRLHTRYLPAEASAVRIEPLEDELMRIESVADLRRIYRPVPAVPSTTRVSRCCSTIRGVTRMTVLPADS